MDVHVSGVITRALRLMGVEVVTAQEDGSDRLPDPDLLDRATLLGAVLFTRDDDFLREGALRQLIESPFAGVIYAHQMLLTDRGCIDDLALVGLAGVPEDFADQVWYLPLK
jgi:Domain of unknown function (DUF5615)